MIRSFILLLLAFSVLQAPAQQAEITGKVTVRISDKTTPIEGATVELRTAKDSKLVKTEISSKDGLTEFENIREGAYVISASATGFARASSSSFELSASQTLVELPAIVLEPGAGAQLTGVTVTAKKPFVQRLNDRLVVNVESGIVSAGRSALDVLEQSPGITVDQNDAISLRGRSGVIIMIDGKPSPMTGTDLATYLKGLPASAIERIEIITNPSAKYDAAGNSGIIDIRMKKDQRMGTNGNFSIGVGHGKYPKANTGFQLNHRSKTVNVFGSYNYNYRELMNHLIINRNFYTNNVLTGSDDKDNFATFPMNTHTARFGMDVFPSKNTIIGFVVSANSTHVTRDGNVTTRVKDANNQPYFNFISRSEDDNSYKNAVANVNFKQTFSAGRELTADLDYGRYRTTALTRTSSYFYELDGSKKSGDKILDGDQYGDLSFKTAKVDYVNPMKKGMKLEMGFKTSYVTSDNDAKFFDGMNNTVDTTKTNRFFYHEYNNAGYVNISREFKKFNIQAGLRGERTDVDTRQVKKDRRWDSGYLQLFPSAYFNYKLTETQTLGVSVSRRIDRPGYSQLNPFLMQIDASIYGTGNPALKPQLTWSYEMSYTRKNMSFTLGYSHTKDPQSMVLSRILDVIPDFEIAPGQDSNITVQIPVNLESTDYFGFTATTPLRINSWWNMVNNVNIFYNHSNANLGGAKLNDGGVAMNLRTNNNFTFKKGWGAELNANLNTGGRQGYSISEPSWGLAAGVQKTVLKGKGTVRLNVTDIFWTNLPKAQVNYPGRYVENWRAYRETRVANLNFIYRFGNNKVQAARNRKTASEEETRRAG